MRILFVCKRHPQQRDLIERPYGRFHHLPTHLAALGHDVGVATCSYRGLPSLEFDRQDVAWFSDDVVALGVPRFLHAIRRRAIAFAPDWVVGCSDAWFGPLARHLARRSGAKLAIDAYDNYEAYMRWNLPLHWAWRRALRAAPLVTAAGPQLADHLDLHRLGRPPAQVLPMAADPEFHPRDRDACRNALGLPSHAPLLGYVGSWTRSRGTHLILDAFARVRARRPDARLVLSGRPPPEALRVPGIIGVGYLPDAQLPVLVGALDVAGIVTADTAFGRFSYPAKLCEAMACGTSVVATATAPLRWMLGGDPRHLAPLGDPAAFADRVLALLDAPSANYPPQPDWATLAAQLAALLATH
ncbi:MAG TPA: glycosyltransferase family 4 protein [Xanthomonadaceae bacterium]|nr:glycosyltransferase family 4 protein [Xanthomonadaceae bacterium]